MNKDLLWKETGKRIICRTAVMNVAQTESISPRGERGNYIVMDAPDWVIAIPVLRDENGCRFVMVEQWRHGSRSLSIEFPGGVMNAGEQPAEAAVRELQEETGYTGTPVHLGSFNPNPAIMANTVHVFMVENPADTGATHPDSDEFVFVRIMKEQDVYDGFGTAAFPHALMASAALLYRNYREKNGI